MVLATSHKFWYAEFSIIQFKLFLIFPEKSAWPEYLETCLIFKYVKLFWSSYFYRFLI